EGAILEDGVGEGVGGDHLDHQAGLRGDMLQLIDDPLTLLWGRVEAHDVVVAEGEPRGAELGEPADVRAHLQGWGGRRAELVLGLPSCGPQTEGEPVVTSRGGGSHQKSLLRRSSAVRHRTALLVSYRN